MNNLSEGIAVLGSNNNLLFKNNKLEQIIFPDHSHMETDAETDIIILNQLKEYNLVLFDQNLNILLNNQLINLEGRDLDFKLKQINFDLEEAVLILIQDVTEINLIGKIEAENKYSTLLIATVTHELRTPTTAIANSIHLLSQMSDLDTSMKNKLIDVCGKSSKMLLYLIDDIMVYIYIYIS